MDESILQLIGMSCNSEFGDCDTSQSEYQHHCESLGFSRIDGNWIGVAHQRQVKALSSEKDW